MWFHSLFHTCNFLLKLCPDNSTHVTEYCAVIGPTLYRASQQTKKLPDPFPLLRNRVWPHETRCTHASGTCLASVSRSQTQVLHRMIQHLTSIILAEHITKQIRQHFRWHVNKFDTPFSYLNRPLVDATTFGAWADTDMQTSCSYSTLPQYPSIDISLCMIQVQ